ENTEQTANKNGVAHIRDGRVDEHRLVVDHFGTKTAGQPGSRQQVTHVARYVDRVPAQTPEDRDRHGVLVVEANRQQPVPMVYPHVGYVFDAKGLVVLDRYD